MGLRSIEEKVKLQSVLVKNQRIAIAIGAIVLWSAIGIFFIYRLDKPLVSTSYYHANIQFRAGNEDSYDEIFLNSLSHIVDMYNRHPNWKWTLECQGLLIQMSFERYPDIFSQMQVMNQRGQMELICPQYSHGLAVAYPYKDFAETIQYNKWLIEDVYNFTVSKVIVLQEGQWLPAFPLLNALGFNAMAISRDQFSFHNYFPHDPLVEWNFGGQTGYVIPLNWLPCFEAGVFHHQLMLSDSERSNTNGKGALETEHEFRYNPEKMRQIERRHIELERMGNIWMTMEEWVIYCLDRGDVGVMNKFMPESNWTPNRHQGVTRWMAWNNANTPDGIMLARNYYTRNRIQMAQIMLEHAKISMAANDTDFCREKISQALRHLWLAQVTDTTGVNPATFEFKYGLDNTRSAQEMVDEAIALMRDRIIAWQAKIQVDAYGRSVVTEQVNFMNLTITGGLTEQALESKYGFDLVVNYQYESLYPHNRTFSSKSLTALVKWELKEFEVDIANFAFMGPYMIHVNNTQLYESFGPLESRKNYTAGFITEDNKEGRSSHYIQFLDNWQRANYSPSMAENYTREIIRSDYYHPAMQNDEFYIVALPIANGFIYNYEGGYAIIKNTTVNHISVRWFADKLVYFEEFVEYNHQYEFIFFKGSLADAHFLASIINPYPTITLEAI
jgi:hypothetical protein